MNKIVAELRRNVEAAERSGNIYATCLRGDVLVAADALDRLSALESSGGEVTLNDLSRVMAWIETDGRPKESLLDVLQQIFGPRLAKAEQPK